MAYRNNEERAPKPYDFVPIAPLSGEDRERPQGHDRYQPNTVSGRMAAILVVATPLHISSGRMRLSSGQGTRLVREITRTNGRPCVPASTLKGTIRSVVEAITRSCVRITRAVGLPSGASECRDKANLCLACRMFGALGYEGNVRFDDAVLDGDRAIRIARMPALYAPRTRTGAYSDAKRGLRGRKFYYHGRTITESQTPVETIVPEARLPFNVRFDNLAAADVGVLLTAMGLGQPPLVLKIGGGKPACYGSVIILPAEFEVWPGDGTAYTEYDVGSATTDMREYIKESTGLIQQDQLRELARLWRYDLGRQCPDGNY